MFAEGWCSEQRAAELRTSRPSAQPSCIGELPANTVLLKARRVQVDQPVNSYLLKIDLSVDEKEGIVRGKEEKISSGKMKI